MKKYIPHSTILYAFILMAPYAALYASYLIDYPPQQLPQLSASQKRILLVKGYCREYELPTCIAYVIRQLVYGNLLKYKNKELPSDLSGQDLCGYDFTGCRFTSTNLTDSNLQDIILTNTTCDYLERFKENYDKHEQFGEIYFDYVCSYLKYISKYYLNMEQDEDKAKLLHIASSFALLPLYRKQERRIQAQYWCFELVLLKQKGVLKLKNGVENLLEVESSIAMEVHNYCWKTTYKGKLDLSEEKVHANFDYYLQDFNNGIKKYNNQSSYNPCCYIAILQVPSNNYYVKEIRKSIDGLRKVYSHMPGKELQQKACWLGLALSKSYQLEKGELLAHYLSCQKKLVSLKKMAKKGMREEEMVTLKDLYYSGMMEMAEME